MTTLAIMATYEKKRLKCYGTVAAGEHVAVTITDGAQWIGEGTALRLRVLFGSDTVAVFPFADGDVWTATGTQNADAYCELNLNTLQAEKYLKRGGTCLWILDDVENHTLYATGEFEVLPWPKRRGIDEPIDLDGYPLLLDEINGLREEFEAYQQTVSQMLATKQDTIFDLATIRSGAAAGATAVQPSQIARFVDGAEYKQSYGEQNKPAILFKHGTNVIVALDATPFVRDGMVSDVKVVGGNLVITFNTDSGKQPIEIPLTDIFNPDNYYDKTAVDNKLAGKADKVANATAGNLAGLDENGNLTDSGKKPADFAEAMHTHTASQITDLGTAAKKDVPISGNASTTQVVLGSDTRLNDARTPTAHTHTASDVTDLGSQLAPKVARSELFPAWAADTAYTTYSLVIHDNAVYKCTTAHTSGAEWDSTKWSVASGADVLGVLLNYLALSNKPQINGNTLTGEGSQSGADLGLLDLAGGTMTGDLNVGDLDHPANIFARGNVTVSGGMYAPSLNLQPNYGEYLDIVRVDNTWVIRITHGNTGALISIPLSSGTMALLQNIADDFDSSDSYSEHALCIHDGTLYRCTNENGHTGDWDAADFAPATVEDVLAALRTAIAGKADASAIPYTLGTPIVINAASSETVEGETVYYGAATLADRTANIVQVTAATALDELRITFPTATSGKVRDFGLRVEIGTGSAALTAPALVPIAPTGETIKIENNAAEIPALADGTATAKGVTLLYFSENAPGVFVVKGEQVEEVA